MEEKGHQFGKTSTEVSEDVNSDDEVENNFDPSVLLLLGQWN